MSKEKKPWVNHEGSPVPESAISPFDKKKEPKVNAMLKKAMAAIKARNEANQFIRETGDAMMKELYANKGQEFSENDGYTVYNYDKSIRLIARKNSSLELSSEVNIAVKLFNQYLDKALNSEEHKGVRQLVEKAFSTRAGELDPKRLVTLLSLKIEDDKWKEAIKVLQESMSTGISKRYFKLSIRNSEGEYEDIW